METTNRRRRKVWGWGFEDQQPPHDEVERTAAGARAHFGFDPVEVERPVALEDVELPRPRLQPPASLAAICRSDPYERASHAYGKSYRDLIRGFRGQYDHPPDVVAHPGDEAELEAVLAWCADAGAAAIPFGGGTSVVGGVEPVLPGEYAGAVTINLRRLDRVLEVDPVSRAARIQAGATGPGLEDQLRELGLTLRHYPQSFEYSTLGGWVATRAGGHFATLDTHIDDLVESVRALTPRGVWESRRLPASGAGPSPDRLLIGSEGTLGVITEAWVRVRERPRFRASAGVTFDSFERGAAAVRALAQSGLHPANCRLLDPGEGALTGAASGGRALLVLGFESADGPVGAALARGLELCRDHGGDAGSSGVAGTPSPAAAGSSGATAGRSAGASGDRAGESGGEAEQGGRDEAESAWRNAFLQAPYLRDTLVAGGVLAETFETAVTWDRFESFVASVRERTVAALGEGLVTCRLTHAYPDGAAPYFTVLAPARRGSELEQWAAVKEAAAEAILAAGGTITHHHAVGRDHRPWYDQQRPELFADALRAAKRAVDPDGILNPGVLIDPA